MSEQKKQSSTFSNTLADAAERGSNFTVLVKGRRRMPSSGIFYKANLILTANHAIESGEDIPVLMPAGNQLTANVAGRDPGSDLALLRLSESSGGEPGVVKTAVRVGDLVLALGRPSSLGIEASLGVISAVNGPVRTHHGGLVEKYFRTDALPLPGFSGGPLVNSVGELIGINTSGLSHGTLLTIPVDVAWDTAKNLAEFGTVKRGYLGIRSQLVEVPESVQAELDREQETGLLIVHVEADSPALNGGLLVGDIIIGIAGNPVRDHDELLSQLTGRIVGKSTQVEVLRGGVLETIAIVVGERPVHKHERHGKPGRHHGHHRHR